MADRTENSVHLRETVPIGGFELEDHLVERQITDPNGPLRPVFAELHRYAWIFNVQFKLHVGRPLIRIDRLRRNCLGGFTARHNGFGLVNEIAIDDRHVLNGLTDSTAWTEVLATLVREMLHCWEHQQQNGTTGRGNYHTRRLRDKAAECGLLIDRRGVFRGVVEDGPFALTVERHGIRVPRLPLSELAATKPRQKTKQRRWHCLCGINARIVVEVDWTCNVCGGRVELAASEESQ